MSVAFAVTLSSPARINITTVSAAKPANATWCGKNMSNTNQSNQLTGAGGQSALRCAGCDTHLQPQEVYACDTCAAGWMQDENFRMHGENDEKSQAAM